MGLEKTVEGGPEVANLCKEEAIQAAEVAKQSAMKAAAASQKATNLLQTAKDISEGKAVILPPKADKGKAPPAPPAVKGAKGPDKGEVTYYEILLLPSFNRGKKKRCFQCCHQNELWCCFILLCMKFRNRHHNNERDLEDYRLFVKGEHFERAQTSRPTPNLHRSKPSRWLPHGLVENIWFTPGTPTMVRW